MKDAVINFLASISFVMLAAIGNYVLWGTYECDPFNVVFLKSTPFYVRTIPFLGAVMIVLVCLPYFLKYLNDGIRSVKESQQRTGK